MSLEEAYSPNEGGTYLPAHPVEHRTDEYDPAGFEVLRDMQTRHFWYLGRHRFLLGALRRSLRSAGLRKDGLRGIDLGGGCGGWIRYLQEHSPRSFEELALGDSSLHALALAGNLVGSQVKRYQIDLLHLQWTARWDVAFLLDVLEHIPDDHRVLRQVREALVPGGLLLVTTPALSVFWTYNDELAHHVRRYSRKDFSRLARACGLELCLARYFLFFLSPLLLLSRLRAPDWKNMSEQKVREHLARTHRVPAWPVNQTLHMIFSLETPWGLGLPFPWGTSVLAVLRRPR
jgi:SAM-dependent methyltransferase